MKTCVGKSLGHPSRHLSDEMIVLELRAHFFFWGGVEGACRADDGGDCARVNLVCKESFAIFVVLSHM